MATLNVENLKIENRDLYKPPLDEIVNVLSNGLTENFSEVSVEIVDCPDLTKKPFSLTCSGLNGNPHIFDIGGVPYLMPKVKKEKLYDLPKVCQLTNSEPLHAFGAGAGPWTYLGVNCEGIYNFSIINGCLNQQSRIASISPIGARKSEGLCKLEILPQNERACSILANIFTSQGMPGKVLQIICKKRIGNDDYVSSIRKCLNKKYGQLSVGMGGTFLLKQGRAKEHIMPDFSKTPLHSDEDVNDWLHFFEMSAPLINVGTLVSHDPGLDLRVQHFHTFSDHNEGGHYHIDVTPQEAEYVGYFVLANTIIRVDAPEATHSFGRD